MASNRRIQPVLISPSTYATGLQKLYEDDQELEGGIEMRMDLFSRLELESVKKEHAEPTAEKQKEEEADGSMSHIVLEDFLFG